MTRSPTSVCRKASSLLLGDEAFLLFRIVSDRLFDSGELMQTFSEQWDDLIAWLDRERRDQPRQWFRSLVCHDRWRTSYWVMRQINEWGKETMARGKSKPSTAKTASNKQWTTFVEISLAGHDLADIEQAFGTVDALFDALHNMLVDGYRVSLSHNVQNDAIIASVTCKDEDSTNAGCTYTSFAADWVTALKIAAYKHYIVTEQNWLGVAGTSTKPAFG